MALCMATMFAFTACSDDDDPQKECYFEVSIENLKANGSADTNTLMAYVGEVEAAYVEALGGNSTFITTKGEFKTLKEEMKRKFEGAVLPDPLIWEDGNYSFTYVLKGSTNPEKMETIASKTFSNPE